MEEWYVTRNGRRLGPFTTDRLESLRAEGWVRTSDAVGKGGGEAAGEGRVSGFVQNAVRPRSESMGERIKGAADAMALRAAEALAEIRSVANGPPADDGGKPIPLLTRLAESGKAPIAVVAAALAVVFPLGVYLVLKHPSWRTHHKAAWIAVGAAILLVGMLLWVAVPIWFAVVAGSMALWVEPHEPRWSKSQRQAWLYCSVPLSVISCLVFLPRVSQAGGLADYLPHKPGAKAAYEMRLTAGDEYLLEYDFTFKADGEVERYVRRVKKVVGGAEVDPGDRAEELLKKNYTKTATTRVQNGFAGIKIEGEGDPLPLLKLDAKPGDTWQAHPNASTAWLFSLERFGEHQGFATAHVRQQVVKGGKVVSVCDRTFAKNVGLIEEEWYVHKGGEKVVAIHLRIGGYDRLSAMKSNPVLTNSERTFFE